MMHLWFQKGQYERYNSDGAQGSVRGYDRHCSSAGGKGILPNDIDANVVLYFWDFHKTKNLRS